MYKFRYIILATLWNNFSNLSGQLSNLRYFLSHCLGKRCKLLTSYLRRIWDEKCYTKLVINFWRKMLVYFKNSCVWYLFLKLQKGRIFYPIVRISSKCKKFLICKYKKDTRKSKLKISLALVLLIWIIMN